MSYEFAAFWLDAIAIGAAILWGIGAAFVTRSARVVEERVEGETEVEVASHAFVQLARTALSRGIANSPLSRIALVDVRDDSLTWQGGGGGVRHSASLRASGNGASRARVVWQLEATSGMITGARWVVAAAAVATVGIYWLLSTHVLPVENPGVRGQVFQMAQALHFLWPPFLLAGLARALKRRLVKDLERTLGNLRFETAA